MRGLEPDNLLAFLALLGLLRALETARPEWQPRVAWRGKPTKAELHLLATVNEEQIVAHVSEGIKTIGTAYTFDRKDIDYSREDFRAFANAARVDHEKARLVSALGSDGALKRDDSGVEPTPLCAMFGQGHQHFLSRLEVTVNRDQPANKDDLCRALFEVWNYDDNTESFRWDPIEDRRYAHQFGDPSENKNKIGTVSGANRLAAIGFGGLTSVPTQSGIRTLGVAGPRREREICWPLVAIPTSLAGYQALLAHPALVDQENATVLVAYGVAGVARARRYQVGKFFNFERARIQLL